MSNIRVRISEMVGGRTDDSTGTKPCTKYVELLGAALLCLEEAEELDSDYVDDIVAECKRSGVMECVKELLCKLLDMSQRS